MIATLRSWVKLYTSFQKSMEVDLIRLVIEGIALQIHLIACTQPFVLHQRCYIAYGVSEKLQHTKLLKTRQRSYVAYLVSKKLQPGQIGEAGERADVAYLVISDPERF